MWPCSQYIKRLFKFYLDVFFTWNLLELKSVCLIYPQEKLFSIFDRDPPTQKIHLFIAPGYFLTHFIVSWIWGLFTVIFFMFLWFFLELGWMGTNMLQVDHFNCYPRKSPSLPLLGSQVHNPYYAYLERNTTCFSSAVVWAKIILLKKNRTFVTKHDYICQLNVN